VSTEGLQIFSLAGRVAIVTGGNRGIGLAIAEGLAKAGATIVIAARDRQAGAHAAAGLGPNALFIETEITRPDSCLALVRATESRFGRLDILVNNAGIMRAARAEDTGLADWQAVLDINLTGAFLCAQAAYPALRRQRAGKIINLGSLASTFGTAASAAYACSKGGIVQLTRSLAVSWGSDNIQVNAILPGYIESDMTRRAETERPGAFDAKRARTPAGRIGLPSDIAGAAIFLASDASSFITGTSITIDGGYSVQI
jgi:2-deoxy-D-gluconate 3-dehydrogenase